MSDIVYRSAMPEDADIITRLHHLVLETSMPYLPLIHTIEEGISFFSTVIEHKVVLIAEIDGTAIGYCAYGDGWVNHLYIHPDYQGHGIGTELLKRAMAASDFLQLWVFQKNVAAIRFYERFGFRLVRETDGTDNEEQEPDALYAWSK